VPRQKKPLSHKGRYSPGLCEPVARLNKVAGLRGSLFELGDSRIASFRIGAVREPFHILGDVAKLNRPDRPARAFKRMRGDFPIALARSIAECRHSGWKLPKKKRQYFLFKRLVTESVAAQMFDIDRRGS